MSGYKFHIRNKQDITDERVNKHKDFKGLLYNYQKLTKPLYKTPLYKSKNARIFLVLLIVLLLLYIIGEKQ